MKENKEKKMRGGDKIKKNNINVDIKNYKKRNITFMYIK